MTVLVFIVLLQSRPRNLPLCSLTAAATLLVRSSLLSVIMSLCQDLFSQYFLLYFSSAPGDAVLGREGAWAGAQAGQGGQVRAQPQVQRDHAGVNTQV